MQLVFDLDECLVATREANRAAYASLGVTSPRISDHMPARYWMRNNEIYEKKHRVFPEYLRKMGRLLPTFNLLRRDSVILTGTSTNSVLTICRVFPVFLDYVIIPDLSPDMKIEWLRRNETGIYFDDWSEFVERVRRETRWQSIDTSRF